ncbi:MAG: tRNA pseudouridine(55) synthase TruB [Chloroflexota bacterium]
MPDAVPFGFLNIDKPHGITSHDVVSKVRRVFGIKKVGHAGTLDPLATGVLILCVGGATRLSEYVMHQTKVYRATVKLGVTTTTYDAEGDITEQKDATHITQADVEPVLPRFTGDIEQYPPIYSAIKQGGKKLYELAREGKTVERKARNVRIDSLDIVEWRAPEFVLDVTCSSGTYIRSLAYDIGEALAVGGYLSGLVRTRSGQFLLENGVTLETLQNSDIPANFLISPAQALTDYPSVILTANDVTEIVHGRRATQAVPEDDSDALAFAYSENDEFIAILKARHGKWYPHKVFSGA